MGPGNREGGSKGGGRVMWRIKSHVFSFLFSSYFSLRGSHYTVLHVTKTLKGLHHSSWRKQEKGPWEQRGNSWRNQYSTLCVKQHNFSKRCMRNMYPKELKKGPIIEYNIPHYPNWRMNTKLAHRRDRCKDHTEESENWTL